MFPAPATCGGDRGVSVQGEEGADGGGTKGAEKRRKENRERERESARARVLGSDWSAWIPVAKQACAFNFHDSLWQHRNTWTLMPSQIGYLDEWSNRGLKKKKKAGFFGVGMRL